MTWSEADHVNIANLEEFLPKIVWRKLDRKNSLIAEGVNIVNINFVRKTTVQVDGEGSVLTLAPVTHRDAGEIYPYLS